MSKTLTKHLQSLKDSGKKLFIPYIMAGDHDRGLDGLDETLTYLKDLGVSAVEVGIPFSDPVADGPVIELAGQRSLQKGTNLRSVIKKLQEIDYDLPIILMTYFNPVFQYGVERLIKDLEGTAVKGLIIPDVPYEESSFITDYLADSDVALLPLVSLTTGSDRQKILLEKAEGFVYAVAVNGVTGKAQAYKEELDGHLARLRDLSPIPVLTGFGVSSLDDVRRFNQVSDGVIVGSKIVKALHEKDPSLTAFLEQAVEG